MPVLPHNLISLHNLIESAVRVCLLLGYRKATWFTKALNPFFIFNGSAKFVRTIFVAGLPKFFYRLAFS